MGKNVSIHINPAMAHQVEFANYFENGFRRLGIEAKTTAARTDDAEIHVVIGPHYAKEANTGKDVWYVDRCYWGNHREVVSLSRLDMAGGKILPEPGHGMRPAPQLQPWKTGKRALYLHDWANVDARDVAYASKYYQIEQRQHPADNPQQGSLEDALARNDLAIGKTSTALVAAAIAGLPVITRDLASPVYEIASHTVGATVRPNREAWLRRLSWANWGKHEINNGNALEFFYVSFGYH